MPEPFDPYRTWFGISVQEQPPNHYRLLGLDDFESDPSRIRDAGEKRTQFLQDVSTGKNVTEAQTLLNQVASALVCLTNPQKKAEYDLRMRGMETQTQPPPSPQPTSAVKKPSGKSAATKKLPKKNPLERGNKKVGLSVWGYFITIPVLIAALAGAFVLIKGKIDSLPDKNSGVATNQDWASGKTVSENFMKASSSAKVLTSPIGLWEFGEGVAVNETKVAGQKFLQLTGGSNRIAKVTLSPSVDRKGILTLTLRRWSSRVDFELDVQASTDGTNWKTLAEASYSGKVPDGRQAGAVWSSVYELSDPAVTHLRLQCSSRQYANKKQGGLLIDSIMIEPRIR